MVSQDLIFSILPRQTGQVEHKKRMIEKIVRRSALKSVEENDSPPNDTVTISPKQRRGERRKSDRRTDTEREDHVVTTQSKPKKNPKSPDDDQTSHLDIFV